MTVIYKNFAESFNAYNRNAVGDRSTLVSGQRAYIVGGSPYFGKVHFPRVSESWVTHEKLQSHFKSNASLHNRIWAGTAGEVNLSYMAVSKAPAAVLFDINPFQRLFWNSFFKMLGETPDPQLFAKASRQFLKDFYFDLTGQFNLQAIQEDHPGLHMQSPVPSDHLVSVEEQIRRRKAMASLFDFSEEVDCSDITEPRCLEDVEHLPSPIRNMNYKQFYQEIRTDLGWKGTGSISCADKNVQWIANEELYNHLHLMAKNNAIAAVTLDVTDKPSCHQLKECLDNALYTPLDINGDAVVEESSRQGALIGNIYLSNILYYLDYSEEEVDELAIKGERPVDFSGHEVSREDFKAALKNMKSLTCDDAAVLRFDKTRQGLFARPEFEPLFSVKNTAKIKIPKPYDPGGLII